MEEIKKTATEEQEEKREYLTEKEAKTLKELFGTYLRSYKEKDVSVSDREWLEQLFRRELPEMSEEEARRDAAEIVDSIGIFDQNLRSIDEAAKNGISKERWLADKLQEASVGMSVNEYGKTLQAMDDMLYQKNMEMAEALSRSADGHIMMSRNLDGNIAENMIAKTTELSGHLQGKHVKVEVLESFTSNSVDVRATNLDTGKYQNYQLKFGKDAKATIDLIERGNYNNQRIVVPSEQLEEVQSYFKQKGSNKTITDHIDAWGAQGKKFTKEQVKELQRAAQEDGAMPNLDYSHYQTKNLALSIGKNTAALGLQSAAVTTGLTAAERIFKGEPVDPEELVEVAIKTGVDTSIKTVTAGILQVAVRKGLIQLIPKSTPAGVIANIACVGIENLKILAKVASGELSLTKGLDRMGRTTTSMVGGLCGMVKGAGIGAAATAWIPLIGPALSVLTGFVGGMVGYFGGSKIGDVIYSAGKKVASVAKNVAKTVVSGLKKAGTAVLNAGKSIARGIGSLLGW
ncbi:MAG: hypothetical protein Q4A78_12420 [Peptostreptococcaceae bacterium]|nr:hypothetical protein [Peptostreptococcaceae bacterium]